MALLARRRRLTASVTFPDERPGALVAAAQRSNPIDAAAYRRLSQGWQRDAFRFYNTLGECWYPTQFYAKALAKLRIFAATKDEQGEIEESAPDSWEAQQLDRIQDPGGGRSRLLYSYGRLWFLAGEAWLLGQDDENGEERWEFLSSSELRAVPGGSAGGAGKTSYVRFEFPGSVPEEIDDAPDDAFSPLPQFAVVYRFWNPHPEYSRLADGPVRSVLPLYQQLELLEASFGARLKSRLAAAGLLAVAQELEFGTADGQNEDDAKAAPFGQRLQQSFVRPIREPTSAGAVAPIVIRIPSELIEKKAWADHIKIHDPNEVIPELEHWEKVVQRVALGLDMPPEILLGMTDANHWTAWQIDDQTWTAHLQPVAQTLVDNLGSAFLRPLARQEGIPYAEDIVVGYDAADILVHPDRGKDAKDLHDRIVISDAALREATGFSDEDAPSPEEVERGILLKVRNAAMLPEFQQTLPLEPGPPSEQTDEALQVEESQVSASAEPVSGLALRVFGAAEVALDAARGRAGSRIHNAARRANGGCPDCLMQIEGVPKSLVASALGQERTLALGLSPVSLTAGGADSLPRVLAGWGVEESAARRLVNLVEAHAARTLFEPEPLPVQVLAGIEATLRSP